MCPGIGSILGTKAYCNQSVDSGGEAKQMVGEKERKIQSERQRQRDRDRGRERNHSYSMHLLIIKCRSYRLLNFV